MFLDALNDNNKLKARYLLWLYKTTKEELERIDRKFTQLEIDRFLLKEIKAYSKAAHSTSTRFIKKYLEEFSGYIANKEKEGSQLKFDKPGIVKARYIFLVLKLSAIENAIHKFFGKKALREITILYQKEMVRRILEERQHK